MKTVFKIGRIDSEKNWENKLQNRDNVERRGLEYKSIPRQSTCMCFQRKFIVTDTAIAHTDAVKMMTENATSGKRSPE